METWVMIAGIILGISLGCTLSITGVKSWILILLGAFFMGLGIYLKYLGQKESAAKTAP